MYSGIFNFSIVQNWSYKDQDAELMKRAPTFRKALVAAAARDPDKIDDIRPALMTAAGTLLQTRNKDMVAHSTLTGLMLDMGNASKQTQARLQKRKVSIAPSTIKNKQIMLGVGFDSEVLEWKSKIEAERTELRRLVKDAAIIQQKIEQNNHTFQDRLQLKKIEQQLDDIRNNRHPGFKLIGDNIDFSIVSRYWSRQDGRKSIHYFNFLAVLNRVSGAFIHLRMCNRFLQNLCSICQHFGRLFVVN